MQSMLCWKRHNDEWWSWRCKLLILLSGVWNWNHAGTKPGGDMERIKIENGGVWPDPTGEDFKALMWRLLHAPGSLDEADLYCAATVMDAYSTLILHPALNLRRVAKTISSIRKHIATSEPKGE
jgi:hypothetical protein